MKKIVLLFSLAVTLLLTACGPREIPAKGDFFTVSIPEAAGIRREQVEPLARVCLFSMGKIMYQ